MNRTLPAAGAITVLVLALAALWTRQAAIAPVAVAAPEPPAANTQSVEIQPDALNDLAAWPATGTR